MTDTLASTRTHRVTQQPTRRRLLLAPAVMAAAALVWALVELGFGYDLRAPNMGDSPGMDIGAGAVLASSGLAGLAAWASLAALERWSPRPRLVWTVLASVVFLVSLGGPLGGEGIDTANQVILITLHTVVALGLIPGLAATAKGGRR